MFLKKSFYGQRSLGNVLHYVHLLDSRVDESVAPGILPLVPNPQGVLRNV